MTFTPSWHADRDRGKSVELEILDQIRRRYPSAVQIPGHWHGYDIWVPEAGHGVEVKFDPRSLETGNWMVEIQMGEEPSALLKTDAAWWVLCDGRSAVWITPAKIVECILCCNLDWVKHRGPGDFEDKKAYRIKKAVLQPYIGSTVAMRTGQPPGPVPAGTG